MENNYISKIYYLVSRIQASFRLNSTTTYPETFGTKEGIFSIFVIVN